MGCNSPLYRDASNECSPISGVIVADDRTWGSSKSRRGDVMMPSPLHRIKQPYCSTATGPAFAFVVPTFVSSKE